MGEAKEHAFRYSLRLSGRCFFLVGLTISVGMLHAPKAVENRRHDREILSLTARDVRSVVLDREYKNEAVKQSVNLVHKPITVTDREEVASICEALRSAKMVSPNHPTGRWYCALTLVTSNGHIEIRVERTTGQGVILWLRKSFRCDEMGTVLESIARKHDFGKLTPAEAEERQRNSCREIEDCAAIFPAILVAGAAFIFFVVPVIPMWNICRRVGFSPSISLLMLVPFANIVLLFIIGLRQWPIDRHLEKLSGCDQTKAGDKR